MNLGAVYNREEVTGSDEIEHTAELLSALSFRRYKVAADSPGIETSLYVFTDITSADRRYRVDFKFNIAWKIIGDYTFNFSVNNSYDSNPPGTDANKNNVTVVTSIGYTF